jgi:hypothetical protein
MEVQQPRWIVFACSLKGLTLLNGKEACHRPGTKKHEFVRVVISPASIMKKPKPTLAQFVKKLERTVCRISSRTSFAEIPVQ